MLGGAVVTTADASVSVPTSRNDRARSTAAAVKSTADRVLASVGLVLLMPLLLIIALAVRLTSRGPVLFAQQRVGRDGELFTMVKFRTMRVGAEAELAELVALNESDAGVLFKIREDPRVTSVGRWLRRFSLDELPQLLNVLHGTMALVGPRPPLPHEIAGFGPMADRRMSVKPGLTGLWQISGRSDLSAADAIRLDLRYVEQWSLMLDVRLLCKTVGAVLRADGAY